MLRKRVSRRLKIAEALDALRAIEQTAVPSHLGADNVNSALETQRAALLREIDGLDARLTEELRRNTIAAWGYSLGTLTTFGVLLYLAWWLLDTTRPAAAAVAFLSTGGWWYRHFAVLRKERVLLGVSVVKFRPRVTACGSAKCLRDIAREVQQSIESLGVDGS